MHSFSRTEMLIGTEGLNRLKDSTVAVFGIGGVGTYVVEGLARSGVGKLILVDDDEVCLTNINRQLHATHKTLGQPKVEVMKERVLAINPEVTIETYQELYNAQSADRLLSTTYDYVVDAIDMVSAKLDLIERCTKMNIPIMSSMGAGNKMNPTMFEVTDIYKTSYDPLAKVIRSELKKRGIKKLKVVYSKEKPLKPFEQLDDRDQPDSLRRSVPGSIAFVPSVAGLIIASEVVKDLINYKE